MLHVNRTDHRILSRAPMFIADLEEKPVTKLNQYVLAGKIGKGSYAKVYLAVDSRSGHNYAAKSIRVSDQMLWANGTCEALQREVRILRQLSHPNIVKLHEVLHRTDTNTAYLIMEHANFGSLEAHLPILDECDIATVFVQVVHGLSYLHGLGFAHRDIKPSNIMLFQNGRVKIGDFGIGSSFESAETVCGSPAYQAPEFFDDDMYDLDPVKEDVWSLGVAMYETAFGRVPWAGENIYQIVVAIKRDPLTFGPGISEEFKDLLNNMLCLSPSKRYTLQQVLNHPFMQQVDYGHLAETLSSRPQQIRMKQSLSIVEVHANVCDTDYSFIQTSERRNTL